MFGSESNVDEAVGFVRSIPTDEEIFVGFSGGKDSIVTAKIMELSGRQYRLFYSFTGIDPPEVVRFIRNHYPECKFLHPLSRDFWSKLSVNVPPSNRLRWCCRVLKKEPAWQMPHTSRVMGIRAEESYARKKRGRVNFIEKIGHHQYYPIFYWKEWEIWEFIESYQLPYPKMYDEGFDRIGCVVCPFHSEKTGRMHQMYRDRWPKYFDRWERGIKELWEKRLGQGKDMAYDSPEEFLKAWYLDDSARWYAEKRKAINSQMEMFPKDQKEGK